MPRKAVSRAPWEYVVGLLPHRVTACEHLERKGVVYLHWHEGGRRRKRSLGFAVGPAAGKLDPDAVARARVAADQQYDRLVRGVRIETPEAAQQLTIAQGWALATDPEKGKWPTKTPHREEMRRAIERAQAAWGAHTPWAAIGRGELRQLWRRELTAQRAQGNRGVRSAEVVLGRVLTIADWLRSEQHIDDRACLRWPAWRHELAKDAGEYEPTRPRYTADQYRAYVRAAHEADPRFGLLIALGAELRLGQVVRARRSDLDRAGGALRVRGAGLKRGTQVVFTPGQRRALEAALTTGYLAGLEAAFVAGTIGDYPLWPGRRLTVVDGALTTAARHALRASLDRTALRAWHRATEEAAEIPHVPGRGWYALRRAAVDEAKRLGISREGLQAAGGWTTAQMPDRIYADQKQQYAAEEASRVRAQARGEAADDGTESGGGLPQNAPQPAEGAGCDGNRDVGKC
jgi:integrase